MSEKENPFHYFFKAVLNVSDSLQTHIAKFGFPNYTKPSTMRNGHPFPLFNFSLSLSSPSTSERKQSDFNPTDSTLLRPDDQLLKKEKSASPVTKEELGRATWTFLHTLAAQPLNVADCYCWHFQYPDKPTRQQKKDVKELMVILSRMYPCKECADHFKEVLRSNPVQAGSQNEFSQWLCHVHNVVNRSLGKLVFPCERVDARWGKLECEQRACDLQGDNPWD